MEHLNPRGARVVALDKPSDAERGQWYFQRYKMRWAWRTAAAAIETLWAPIDVLLRTSLATEKVRWNIWCK